MMYEAGLLCPEMYHLGVCCWIAIRTLSASSGEISIHFNPPGNSTCGWPAHLFTTTVSPLAVGYRTAYDAFPSTGPTRVLVRNDGMEMWYHDHTVKVSFLSTMAVTVERPVGAVAPTGEPTFCWVGASAAPNSATIATRATIARMTAAHPPSPNRPCWVTGVPPPCQIGVGMTNGASTGTVSPGRTKCVGAGGTVGAGGRTGAGGACRRGAGVGPIGGLAMGYLLCKVRWLGFPCICYKHSTSAPCLSSVLDIKNTR